MTAHTRRRKSFDATQPLDADEIDEIKAFFEDADKRCPIERARGMAERTLAHIEQGNAEPGDFDERAGMGWYSRQIVMRGKWLDSANAKGDAKGAQEIAFEIGSLITEAQLKRTWDDDLMRALANAEIREEVNRQNRKADHSERKAIVNGIMAERGCGASEALRIAALRHPEKGKFTTFRTSYYKKL